MILVRTNNMEQNSRTIAAGPDLVETRAAGMAENVARKKER